MKRFVWFPVGLGLLCVCCLAVFLAAPPAARAAGDGTIVGTVKNASGTTGLPDIWVVAFQPDGSGGWTKFDSAQTAADGSYRLDLPTGSYGIEFHDNSGTYVTECYKNEPNRDLAKFVQVTAGETHLGIDATLMLAPYGAMLLDNGAAATNSTTVTADSAVSGATEMHFASYNGSAWVCSAWQPYAATATVTIYAPDGTKRAYAYYRDAAGNSYKTSDTIILSTR